MTLVDLDGVLLPGDTMASLVLRRLNRVPWRYLAVAGLFAASALAPALSERRARLNRRIVRIALRGVSPAKYAEMADAAGRRLAPRARSSLIAELTALGTRIVVVTATERTLAEAFLRHAGMAHVDLIASCLVLRDGEWTFAWHNYAENKVAAVQAESIALADADFYTDSSSDLPLILTTRSTVLVGPSGRTVRAVRSAAADADIRRWS